MYPIAHECRIRFILKSGKEYYHLSTLTIKDRGEFIYVFEYKDRPKFIELVDHETEPATHSLIRKVDHVSFHQDGTAHIYYKNLKNNGTYMDEKKSGVVFKDLPVNGYLFLLNHSVFPEVDMFKLALSKIINITDGDYVVDVTNQKNFSLILTLLGNSDYHGFVRSQGLSSLIDMQPSRLFFKPFATFSSEKDLETITTKGPDLFIAYTKKVVKPPFKENFKFIPSDNFCFYSFNVFPSISRLLRMT